MDILIVSIDHYLQLTEADTDTAELRSSKSALRNILQDQITCREISIIFEEASQTAATIACQIAKQRVPEIPLTNIIMTPDQRRAAGIFDALQNRPSRPDWEAMSYSIELRIPEDIVREGFFVEEILAAHGMNGRILVLLGDMHVNPVAESLRALGHDVETLYDLVPTKRWE
jgi:hypothetical protein